MNKKRLNITKFLLLGFAVIILASACSSSEDVKSSENEEKVFTIKTASILDETNVLVKPLNIFKDIVEENSGGRIEIEYIGGPESIPAPNQGEAVQNGTLDLSFNFGSYYAEMVPEVLGINYSELTYEEEIEKGTWDYMNEMHENKNMVTLGRIFPAQFGLFTTEKVESTKDLNGLKIRGSTTYVPTLEAFGAEVLNIEGGEIYSALEKGLVDGVAWATFGVTDIGIEEEIEYQILPHFNKLENIWIMNEDVFNELPENLQEILQESAIEAFYESEEVLEEDYDAEQKVLEDAGVEKITLSDEDEFLKTASDASWKWLDSKVDDPEKLENYFRK